MATYAIFLRGSTNARNAVDNCVWVGEAESAYEAKRLAFEIEGVNVYNGQFLEVGEPHEFSEEDQFEIRQWQPVPRPY